MAVTASINPPASAPSTTTKTTTNGTTTATPPTDKDLAALLTVHHGPNFTTKAVSNVSLPPNAVFARITLATPAPAPVYTTVQRGADAHVELNSDLRYVNHSCEPNLVFDMDAMEVRVGSERGLQAGDELTFFYPSTEWVMDRGFECACGSAACLGLVEGAKGMDERTLGRYWVSRHVRELRERQRMERVSKRVSSGGLDALGGKMPLGFRSVAGGGVV
ncbi:galactose-proton symport [Diplodia corticola]|uniref:Galactose-proton symport n=1 Tax=Diplodia corticola TaxID=236234 RepID=A0A1J9RSM6_9PEZI|nr:galactose-proton symport [Diplodia corticola]OJD31439.1 galactose-proton symport [Diplodia corticola]